jgi:hypothetical protein
MTAVFQPIAVSATQSEDQLEGDGLSFGLSQSTRESPPSSSPFLNFRPLRYHSKYISQNHVGKKGGNNSSLYVDNEDGQDKGARPFFHLVWRNAVMHILQTSNILCWYYTNGMNGIAMESFAKQHKNHVMTIVHAIYSTERKLVDILVTTCFVTALQLMIGAVIGRILLFFLNSEISSRQIMSTQWTPLSFLHACGSLATNLGFMYGKASVVQVLKLLEPFETLLLSQFLFHQEGKCSFNTMASMTMVIGGAMSLLKSMKKLSKATAPIEAIVSALASGLLLSCRNVLQRKQQSQQKTASSPSPDFLPTNQDILPNKSLSKLEKSIVQFTQLSFLSGLFVGTLHIMLWTVISTTQEEKLLGNAYSVDPNIQVLLWHPLYNVFSMITLGFCSALTHSLLNAGKRVFAICMAMIWFHEGLNDLSTIIGLLTVTLGGCWYAAANKMQRK